MVNEDSTLMLVNSAFKQRSTLQRRSMKIRTQIVMRFGAAVLFAGALFFLAWTSLRLVFGSSAADSFSYSKATAWELADPDGKPVKSSDFDGKVVILNFGVTSSAPWAAEIPGLIELQKTYGEKGLAVVGVSLDDQGPSVVKEFVKESGINYPVVIGTFNVIEYFGGMGMPSTFIIDRSGKVVARHTGFASKETVEREITPLL
jgi:peroxiredoxin